MFYKVKIINERLEAIHKSGNKELLGDGFNKNVYFIITIIEADTERDALRKGLEGNHGVHMEGWNLDQCYAELVKD